MENQPLDVIIVNFNSTDYTIKCIGSIYASAAMHDCHIIVVDNSSYDYPERIKQTYPDIDLIINKQNMGFSNAVNFALNRSNGAFAVLLNPDTVIYDGFFTKTIQYMNSHEDVGVIGPKVLDLEGSVQGSARRFPTVLTSLFGRKSPLTRFFPNNPVTKKEFVCFHNNGKQPIDVDWVSGACMVIRKKAMVEVGGFDERFFMYWEDTDLCKELKTKGWRVVYFPAATVYHHTGISSDSDPITSIFHFHKSCYLLCKKHAKGIKKALIPLAFWGLSLRCLFVVGLNCFSKLKGKTPLYHQKKRYYN